MAKCISPIKLKDANAVVPCGRCYPCKMRRVSAWSFRLMKEADRSRSAFFVTLTYDNDHVPISNNGFMSLRKRDVQLFLKRLRYYNSDNSKWPLKYYLAGEYGSDTMRPHYHIILFNCTLENLIGLKYENAYVYGNLLLDGKDQYDCDSWPCGHITVGDFSQGSVGYTLKYICKDSLVGKFERDDRVKEFSIMSKRIGDNYLTDAMKRYHLADVLERMFCTTDEGVKMSMPRYFKERIYTKWQRMSIGYQMEKKSIEEYMKLRLDERAVSDERDMKIIDHYATKFGKDDRNTTI